MLGRMAISRGNVVLQCILVALLSFGTIGCDMMPTTVVIDEGEFEGLHIGDSKQNVLKSLRAQDLGEVQARDARQKVIRDSKNLEELASANRVIVSDHAATVVNLDFDDDIVVASIVSANVQQELRASFEQGATREQAFSALGNMMAKDNRLEAFSAIPGVSSTYVKIDQLSEAENRLLMDYDIWFFSLIDGRRFPAAVLLYFEEDQLIRIEYEEHWGY